ncbi:MAG TPA: transporter substrate-binding domain-containing protein [Roseateles sp.]|nr:transporter substrate-binding domain-containing protein [Roseateles sp.]
MSKGVWLLLSLLGGLMIPPAWSQAAAGRPDCSRPLSLALHDHGLLYSAETSEGIDKDFAEELARRSGCRFHISLLPRARIWQLIESGALDFSLSGIATPARDRFAAFAWYFSNKYYLLVRRDAQVARLEDFERNGRLQLGVIRSFRYGESANRFVDRLDAQQRLVLSSGLSALFDALVAGQIQGMIIEPFDYPTLQSERIRALTQTLEFGDPPVPHGLIMSRAALPEPERAKWHALVEGMRSDGAVRRIFEKYFRPELARAMVEGR